MRVAVNADEWAAPRVGIFFTADSGPPANGEDGDLTGQCVTLDKWFFAEMTEIPNPFGARGHARYLGANLVRQGLADEVPNGSQRRGDIVGYEYGEYGHTGVLLSGNRLFQQNANVAGAKRKVLADGTVVYSSTIVPLYASLGGAAPKFYRLRTYKEGNIVSDMTQKQADDMAVAIGLALMFSVEQINSPWWFNATERAKYIKGDPMNYPTALLLDKEVGYNSQHFQQMLWKAVHFDEQVAAAYEKGKAEGGAGGPTYTPVAEVNGVPTLFKRD